MSDSAAREWTLVLVLTALFLSLIVVGQIASRYTSAYWAAPREIAGLLDSADSSLQENESYDRDVAKVPRLEDKFRLGHLLREIQRAGDDLREDLNNVLFDDGLSAARNEKKSELKGLDKLQDSISLSSPRLKTSARILWASKRTHLEERLRRLDMLRMRFLVVYMSIVAASATAAAEKVEKTSAALASGNASNASASPPASRAPSMPSSPRRGPEKTALMIAASRAAAAAARKAVEDSSSDDSSTDDSDSDSDDSDDGTEDTISPLGSPAAGPRRPPFHRHSMGPGLPSDLAGAIRKKPPLRRVSTNSPRPPPPPPPPPPGRTPPILDSSSPEGHHRISWLDVVQELQRSPLLHKRHKSVESAIRN